MRFFSFLNRKRYGGLINDLDIGEFWEYLSEGEREKLRQYSEPILSTYQTKIASSDSETSFIIRSVTKIDDPDTNTVFHVRSASDFLTDLADMAIVSREYILAEKLLTEALAKNTNIFDLHYTYDKFIELYYTLSEIDINFMEKCINACKNDIKVFNEIRKNSYNEYKTLLKRNYKAGLIPKQEYQKSIKSIGPRTAFPIIDAFEILANLYYRKNQYKEAIEVCRQTLKYKIFEEDRIKILNLIEKFKKAELNYNKTEEEKMKLASEAIQNDLQRLEQEEKTAESEIEKEKLKLKLEKLKKVEKTLEKKLVEKNKNELEEEKKHSEENKARVIIKKRSKSRLQEEYDQILSRVKDRVYFKKDEIEKVKKTLSKLITYWEREEQIDFPIKEIVFLNSFLDYYEEKDEKAIKSLGYYINICKKDDKETQNQLEAERLMNLIDKKILKRDYIITGPCEDYKDILNEANEESKDKNYDKAAYLAKKAHESALENNMELSITEELKLPMYLTKAGRYEEAEAIYFNILERDKQDINANLKNIYKTYFKLKTLSNTKKKYLDTMKYGLIGYILQGHYYKTQEPKKYDYMLEDKIIDESILSYTKKTEKEHNIDELREKLKGWLNVTEIDLKEVEEDISNSVYII